MLTIRLSRIGKTNKPMFRLIISEKTKDPYGKALEILGSYNPHTKDLQAKTDRIKHWISQGAGMSPTVNNLLIEKKIIEGEKVKASQAKTKKKDAKTEEKPKKEAKTEGASPEPVEGKTEKKVESTTPEVKEEKPAESGEKSAKNESASPEPTEEKPAEKIEEPTPPVPNEVEGSVVEGKPAENETK